MPATHNHEHVTKLEREILRLLCSLPDEPPERARSHAICNLSAHHWKIEDHRVIFNALRRSPGRDPELLREQLPAEATRLGFPDVDWTEYLISTAPSDPEKVERFTRELLAVSGEDPAQK